MKDLLKKYGYKVTPARVAILGVFNKTKKPLNAEDIAKRVKKINEATIYRTIQSLKEGGILRQVDVRKDSLHFEIAQDHHHHIICTKCDTMEDFESSEIEQVLQQISSKSKFKNITEHSLELFGLCVKCV